MNFNYKYFLFPGLVWTVTMLGCLVVTAQVDNSEMRYKCRSEFSRIANSYDSMLETAVTVTYKYSLSDQLAITTDSSVAEYKFHAGMISASFNELELLQNKNVALTFNREDSFITVSKISPIGSAAPAQLKVFDSAFVEKHVRYFEKSKTATGLNKISIYFKPTSFYRKYEICYTNNYLITALVFEVEYTDLDDNGIPPPAGKYKVVEVIYSNYHHQVFNPTEFDEHRYVRKNKDGKWEGVGLYNNCEVIAGE